MLSEYLQNIDRNIISVFSKHRIKIQNISWNSFEAYSLGKYKIESSERISSKRLVVISNELSNMEGFFIRIYKSEKIVCLEIKNNFPTVIEYTQNQDNKDYILPIPLGRNCLGNDVFEDLESFPHLLISGMDGYGKSSFLNCIIDSLSNKNVRFVLADIENEGDLDLYKDLQNLQFPIIKNIGNLIETFNWIISELEYRYIVLASSGYVNIDSFNGNTENKIPHLVLVISDYSCFGRDSFYANILKDFCCKVCAKAKAAGIHIIASAPAVESELISGKFLNNFPARISFRVDSSVQSKINFSNNDAMCLYYPGDMLFIKKYGDKPARIQAFQGTE